MRSAPNCLPQRGVKKTRNIDRLGGLRTFAHYVYSLVVHQLGVMIRKFNPLYGGFPRFVSSSC